MRAAVNDRKPTNEWRRGFTFVSMQCAIYRSSRKPDNYLYIEFENDFSRIPKALLELLGQLHFVMSIELRPDRKLAQADVRVVMQRLADQGYYLQMPPGDWKASARN